MCSSGASVKARGGAQGVLRTHQTESHLGALLRRTQQRHPQEAPQHGGQDLRMSMIHYPLPPGPSSRSVRYMFLRLLYELK